MSTTIDERVVSMKFDNKDFEKNVAQTIDTLEQLDKKLDFKDADKNFKKIEDASKEVTLSGLTKSAEAVEVKFSAMSIVAITAISRIVDSAMDAGTQLVKSLSIDQVTAGFSKYEQELNSARTIMNATGESIETVYEQLQRLTIYTDETSYSYGDMVNNIAKFTSAGIKLDVATEAMMGIANAAGLAGASVTDASHAMDGFSKAMGQQYMSRENWSWIKTAHMNTIQFQQSLIDAAVSVGTLTKAADGSYRTLKGNIVTATDFETNLADKWLTSAVMMKTFNQYGMYSSKVIDIMTESGAECVDVMEALDKELASAGNSTYDISKKAFQASQEYKTFSDAISATKDAVSSGWMETFRIIMGDVEEAKELWTEVGTVLYDIFAASGKNRNRMLEEWRDKYHGREDIIDSFRIAVENTTKVVEALSTAVKSVFPPMTAERLSDMTKKFKDFISFFKLSEPALYSLQVAVKMVLIPFQVLFEVLKLGVTVLGSITKITFALVNAFLELAAIGNPVAILLEKIFGTERYQRLATAFNTITSKISAMLQKVADKIKSSFGADSLFDVFLDIVGTIAKILAPIAELLLDAVVWGFEQLANLDFTSIQSFMISMLEFFKTVGGGAIVLFTTGLSNLVSALTQLNNFSLKTWFTNLKKDTKSVTAEITGLSKAFSEEGIVKNLTNVASLLSGKLANIGAAVGDAVSKISPASIIVSGLGLTFVELSHNISLAVGSFAKVGTSLAGLMDSVKGVFASTTKVITAFGDSLKGRVQVEKIKAVALAIAVLAGSLALLTIVDQVKLLQVVGNMGLLLLELGAFYAAIAFIGKKASTVANAEGSIKQFAITMGIMAGMLVLVASSIAIMQKVDVGMDLLWRMIALVSGLAALIVAIKILVNKKDEKELIQGAGTILALAYSLRMIAKAFAAFKNIELKDIGSSIAAFAVVVIALKTIAKSAQGIKFQAGAGMIAMVISLLTLTGVLLILAKVDVGALIVGLAKYVLLFGVMLSLALVAKAATTKLKEGESLVKISGMFLSMAAAIAIMSIAIKSIGKMSFAEVAKGTAAVAALLLLFALIIKASNKGVLDSPESVKQNFVGMAMAILAIALAIDYIGGLSDEKVIKGTAAVAALMVMFAILQKVESANKGATGSAVFIGVTIAALVAAMALLSLFPFEKLFPATIALSAVLIAFGQALKYMDKIVSDKKSKSGIIKMVVIIGGLTAALALLSSHDWESLLAASIGLSAVMISFGVLIKMIGGMETDSKKALKAIIPFGALVAALGAVTAGMIALLNLINVNDGLVEKVLSFSLILSEVTGVGVILSKMSLDISKVTKGVGSVIVVMGALAAVSLICWALFSSVEWEGFSSNGAALISSLAIAGILIGVAAALGFVISKVGQVADPGSVAQGLLVVGEVLLGILAVVAVMGAIMVAIDKLGIGDSLKNGGEALVNTFIATGTAIGGFFGGIIGGIGQGIIKGLDLEGIADLFVSFISKFKEIDEQGLENFKTVATSFYSLMDAVPNTGGIKELWEGHADFGILFTNLDEFAEGIKEFCENVGDGSDIDLDGVKTAVEAATIVASLESALLKTGGLVQAWFGQGDLGLFSENLGKFGSAIAGYAEKVDGFDDAKKNAIEKSAAAGKFLSDLNDSLPSTGGIINEWFLGNKSLGEFATNIESFGNALVAYQNSVSGIKDWSIFNTAKVAADGIVTIANAVAEIDYGWFSGSIKLDTFGSQLNSFGSYMKQYSETISDISWTNFSYATSNVDRFIKAVSGVSELNMAAVSTFGVVMGSIGTAGFDAFIDAFANESAHEILDNTASDLVANFASSLNEHSSNADYFYVGSKAVSDFSNGVITRLNVVNIAGTKAADELCNSMEKALKIASPSKRTFKIGEYAIMGLEKGLLENEHISNNAASNVAEHMLQAMKNTLEIHSPSYRVRQEVAKNIIDAIPAEFDENDDAEKAAKAKAEAIVQAFSAGLQEFSDNRSILDLERQLHELKLPSTLSDDEKTAAMAQYDIEQRQKYLETYVGEYKLAVAEWQYFRDKYGEESQYTKDAQLKLMKQEIELRKYAAEMATATNQEIKNARSASIQGYKDLYAFMNSDVADKLIQQNIKDFLKTDENYYYELLGEEYLSAPKEIFEEAFNNLRESQYKAFEESIKDGSWKTAFKDLESKFARELFSEYESEYVSQFNEDLRFADSVDADALVNSLLGGYNVDEFKDVIQETELTDAFIQAVEDSLKETTKTASSAGANAASAYAGGFDLGLDGIDEQVKNALSGFDNEDLLGQFIPDSGSIASWFDNLATNISGGLSNAFGTIKEWVNGGTDVVLGFVNGVKETTPEATSACDDMANACLLTIDDAFDRHSPSKETFKRGVDFVRGFVNGIIDREDNAINTVEGMADRLLDVPMIIADPLLNVGEATTMAQEISDAIEDAHPVITPVLDLTTVNEQINDLKSDMSSRLAAQVSASMAPSTPINQNGSATPAASTTAPITFNQYNTSPKALDRLEIYRQTNNQLSVLKEGLKKR